MENTQHLSNEVIETEIRPEIQKFAEAMEKTMQVHDKHKGDSWKDMSLIDLQKLLKEEIAETEEPRASITEWVDAALICMMIWNIYLPDNIRDEDFCDKCMYPLTHEPYRPPHDDSRAYCDEQCYHEECADLKFEKQALKCGELDGGDDE